VRDALEVSHIWAARGPGGKIMMFAVIRIYRLRNCLDGTSRTATGREHQTPILAACSRTPGEMRTCGSTTTKEKERKIMKHERLCLILSLAGALTLTACGDNNPPVDPGEPDGSVNPPPGTYSVGGSVTGLSGTLTLQNNGGDDLTVTADGSFAFATELADGAEYEVTVSAQPQDQLCTVASGSGTIDGADVTGVAVTCVRNGLTTFSGTLRDQTGAPIAGATLTIGDVSTTSAADGTWTVTDAPLDAVLFVNAGPEFLPFRVDTREFPDGVTDRELVLRRADLQMTIDPGQANLVYIGDAFVEIPILPGIDEQLAVKGWLYDVSSPDAMVSAPVPLRGSDGTTDYGLLSLGMIGMTFTGAESGTAYTDFGTAAEPFRVSMPMPAGAYGLTPTIDLWRATDDDATWQLVATPATYDEEENSYRFEVTRWSIYNLDHRGILCEFTANFAGHMPGYEYDIVFEPGVFGWVHPRALTVRDKFITFWNAAQGFNYRFNVVRKPDGEKATVDIGCSNTPITVEFARDTTAPGPVTSVRPQPDLATCSMTLSWTNPTDADYAGVEICTLRRATDSPDQCLTKVTKGPMDTTHIFSGESQINCANQARTYYLFTTIDNKTPPNRNTPPTSAPFTMQ
jgi:hypothetical protein